jgi:hypothetical protein
MVVRDRTLAKLKVGKQSVAGKAITTFIRELQKSKTVSGEEDSPTPQTTMLTWETRADDFLKEVAGNG